MCSSVSSRLARVLGRQMAPRSECVGNSASRGRIDPVSTCLLSNGRWYGR
jgi:hypothetical protein